MKILNRATGRIHHVEREVGELFCSIADGQFEPVVDKPPQPKQPAVWTVGRNSRTEEPILHVYCPTCKQNANFMGPSVHITARLFHCAIVGGEVPPKDVVRQYAQLAERYHGKLPLATKHPFLKPFVPEFLK